MRVRRSIVVVFAVGVATAAGVAGRNTRVGRSLCRGVDRAARRVRYLEGRSKGVRYRLVGRSPSEHVPDDVLADRVRAELGPLEKQLDVPRVHVMVEDHVVLLHGEVPTALDQGTLERAVRRVVGVRGVESHLHVGLLPGDTRPSVGRAAAAQRPSPALRELLDPVIDPERRARGEDHAVPTERARRAPPFVAARAPGGATHRPGSPA